MDNFSTKKPYNGAVTGIATFAKTTLCLDIRHANAHIAVLGAPFDIAIQGKTGTRLGPRGIRVASTRFSYRPGGSYDPERDDTYLDSDLWRLPTTTPDRRRAILRPALCRTCSAL